MEISREPTNEGQLLANVDYVIAGLFLWPIYIRMVPFVGLLDKDD